MFNKIFRSSFITTLVILLVSFCLVVVAMFEYFEKQIFAELKSESAYIQYAIVKDGLSYIDNFDGSKKRITLIDHEGTVIADTSADPKTLENHSDRKEIKDAFEKGEGISFRYSHTLMNKTLYYACKMEDGSVLRVSTTQDSILVIFLGFLQPLIVIILVVLLLTFLLSRKVSKAIIKPINEMDLENPSENKIYDELEPLLKKLQTQKKTIARQIREAEQKREEFKLITENMSEGLLIIDKNANVLSYNNAALELLGVEKVTDTSVLSFNRTKGFRTVVEDALLGKRGEDSIITEESCYNIIANPVYEQGKIIGAVVVIIDITESAKREQLRREFTSNVSHELKTPLTSISGFAEMMKVGGLAEEAVVDFSAIIYEEAQRLNNLVGDIMKISELDEGSSIFEKENVDLNNVALKVAQRLEPTAKKKGVTITVTGDESFVFGTEKILDEMVYNLCDNAIKYNKENGTVNIKVEDLSHQVVLSVEDTGIGIPQKDQNRVFERFYRVDKSHSRNIGGTGLGLAIVKHGAIYHNAEVRLESKENEGTKITLTFKK